ncbi:hypothetical protein K504DRAFT_446625 [Pleomassaria siparia CBS 279.74]|uniref:DUF7707 domain-containing protein n=1 Tax=Pleomassaria siparia CBS 279.74 TaxID=1314801 RepID=A0A6G1K3P2_9PLEO|nr:hypothetical protein K504DRAFT_446625 [Pleomassaria siparia CBS 279.74]
MRSVLALGVLALSVLSKAQAQYTIDPNSVTIANRDAWCVNQKSQCPLICLQQPGVTSQDTEANDCNPDDLSYSCICDNGVSPNLTMYSQTIPYYVCTEWGQQCVSNCGGVQSCQSDCLQNHPCGAQNAYKGNATVSSILAASSAAAATQTPSSTQSISGFAGVTGTASSGDKKGAAAMLDLGASYSFAVVFASFFFGFAVVL